MSLEGQFRSQGEFVMPTQTVQHIADLAYGAGNVASDLSDNQKAELAEGLAREIQPVTNEHTMVCMEDRLILALGTGEDDPDILKKLVNYQWAGGETLAATKAAVAANAGYLRHAKTFTEAYLITDALLKELGEEDGGHANCGAAALVEKSAAEPVVRDIALPTINTMIAVNESRTKHFDKNDEHKRQLVKSGFYKDWDPAFHEKHLLETVPQNFSYIKTADDAVHGHYGKCLLVVTEAGMGFAKNSFIAKTGEMAFGATPAKVVELAHKLGGTAEEREAILMGFMADLLDVSDKIVTKGFPVFAQAA